jgi:UDP-sulfoquinovose synthase
MEQEQHYYAPDHQHLLDLGYKPTRDMETEVETMLYDLNRYRGRIEAKRDALIPDVRWQGARKRVAFLASAATPKG